jgi:hypothetical protein
MKLLFQNAAYSNCLDHYGRIVLWGKLLKQGIMIWGLNPTIRVIRKIYSWFCFLGDLQRPAG